MLDIIRRLLNSLNMAAGTPQRNDSQPRQQIQQAPLFGLGATPEPEGCQGSTPKGSFKTTLAYHMS